MKETIGFLYIVFFIFCICFTVSIGVHSLLDYLHKPDNPDKPPTTYTVVTEYGTYTGIRHKPYVGYVNESGKEHDFHGSYTMVEE